jgi:outer membrane immunogenic protein
MRRILLVAAAVGFSSSFTLAADLPARAVYKAPVAAPVVYTWTGCYIGGNLGYGWQKNDSWDPSADVSAGSDTGKGVIGGGQVGCDYQFSSKWVIGIQGMFDWARVNGGHTNPFPGNQNDVFGFKSSWFGTLTGRIGYAVMPQTLLYLKGGAAWVHVERTDVDPTYPYSGTASATRPGWTIGAGGAYSMNPHWSVFVEYNYIDIGSHNITVQYTCGGAPCAPAPWFPYTFKDTQNLQTISLGVNYKFDVARY